MIRMASAPHIRLVTEAALQAHAAADIFPMMSDVEFDALVSDIRENGQREPIVVYDGLVLDGRNRLKACEKIGITPRTTEWDRKGTPEAFVVSMNLHRRHLDESQRAMIGGKIATRKRTDSLVPGGARRLDPQICGTRPPSVAEAAQLLNVGERTISDAKVILKLGTPEEIEAVERGDIGVSSLSKELRKGTAPEKRKARRDAPLSQAGNNPERIQRMQMNADIWAKLSEALIGLTSLPLPSDVAEIINANPARRRVVDEKLARSLQWLKEFENACCRRD